MTGTVNREALEQKVVSAETFEKPKKELSLHEAYLDYCNKRDYFIRLTQHGASHGDIHRALNAYMDASDKYAIKRMRG